MVTVPRAPAPSSSIGQLRADVRRFLADELAAGRFEPAPDSWLSGVDPDFSRRLGSRGWLGMTWPRCYGGHQRAALERYVVVEELLAAGAPVAAHWVADRQSGNNILAFGSEELKAAILPRIAAGECYFAIGMSEPDAGSDLASIRTRARRDQAGHWRLSGTKIWTSNAQHCHYAIVLARTAGRLDVRDHGGMSQFIVDLTSPGVAVHPIEILDGTEHLCEVVLDDAMVLDEMLLGAEGAGWEQVTAELAWERSGPERFLSTVVVLRMLAERAAASGDTGQLETVGRLAARMIGLRELSLRIAASLDRGERLEVAAAMVKDLGTTFEADSVEEMTAACGIVPSLTSPDPMARALAVARLHSPAFTLRGGTNEVLRSLVARGLGMRR